MSLLSLANKKILITGALGSIGRTLVKVLAEHDAVVLANDILSVEEACIVLGQTECPKDNVHYLPADTRDRAEVEHLFERCRSLVGLPDVVCCHAGLVRAAPVADFAEEDFDETMALNLRSHFLVAQTAANNWLSDQSPGNLIFTSSWVQDVP